MKARGALPLEHIDRATEGLKKFQLDTVDTVVDAMFNRGQLRFLVADEVGLGKTKVARATVAETIRRLWDDRSVDRIDVIYICSNSQIARQNLRDLDVLGDEGLATRRADRITMLPATLADLGDVNIVAFTPDTSFRVGRDTGRVEERAVLWRLVEDAAVGWGDLLGRWGAIRVFKQGASEDRLIREINALVDFDPPRAVAKEFGRRIREEKLKRKFDAISDGRRKYDHDAARDLIARLRRLLAEVCIDQLSPDLVVLDEFQRFTNLLDGEGDDGELFQLLVDRPETRVLLLSATPYKMLTTADDDESHFTGFERTVEFLLADDRAADLSILRTSLGELRAGLLGHRDPERLAAARDRVQAILSSVMVRTERLAAAPDRDGMLDGSTLADCTVTTGDVEAFISIDHAAQALDGIPSMIEYWKSAPYLFNFMDDYVAKRRVRDLLPVKPELRKALKGRHMLSIAAIDRYSKIDPRNGRLRWMTEDLEQASAFDVLWIPPALPQTELRGAYASAQRLTKRLVFSSWGVVPKAVASLLSVEFERRHHREVSYGSSRRNVYRPLALPALSRSASERFTSLSLLLPCRALADLGDPLLVARETGRPLPLPPTELREHVTESIRVRLAPLVAQASTGGPALNIWYAAAQLWLDPGLADLTPESWIGDERDSQGIRDHWSRLLSVAGDPTEWGAPPEDLAERLADIAIAAPGTAALRSLSRLRERFEVTESELSEAAASIAWAFTSFFHAPEAQHMIEASGTPGQDFWRKLLTYCADGAFGSVLDEWFHLVPDQCKLNRSSVRPLDDIVGVVTSVLRLEDGRSFSDFYDRLNSSSEPRRRELRTHFAMRYGQARGATAEGENPVDVRNAFNSPFHPFVLVSTSVGQEGLDFHYYAHAIVHWNLPGNPVDLEQREGRVHRYKNHAVRKNVAQKFIGDPELLSSPDPWARLFEVADDGTGGMRPHWVFDGDAQIQRLVPTLPLSREVGKLHQLIEATTLYRMTLGQPRQAELMEVLAGLDVDEQRAIQQAVTIDLSPRATSPAPTPSV